MDDNSTPTGLMSGQQEAAATKVSIVIPAYNLATLLPRAVESALNQTYQEVEVVVVDDGSTDETEQVVQPYLKDPRFHYLKQENRGLPAARNRGFREATGEYVNFLDSDDYLHPEMIGKTARILDADDGLAMVYCDMVWVLPDGKECRAYSVGERRKILDGDIFQSLLQHGWFPVHCALIRRSAVEAAGGFDESLPFHEDYDLWLRIVGSGGQARYLDERLAYYQKRSGSMSEVRQGKDQTRLAALAKAFGQFPERCAEAFEQAQGRVEKLWQDRKRLTEEKKQLLAENAELRREVDRLAPYERSYNHIMNKPIVRFYGATKGCLQRLIPGGGGRGASQSPQAPTDSEDKR